MTLAAPAGGSDGIRPRIWNDPWWRALFIQVALLIVVATGLLAAAHNARVNMTARGIPTDFAFWNRPAGFDVNQTLIAFNATYTYGRAFLVGLLNTLVVAVIGIVFSTILGFAIGAARLSKSWLVARLATVYVETIRNIPLLLQMLFWYNAVLNPLPGPRQSFSLLEPDFLKILQSLLGVDTSRLDIVFLNNRGLFVPEPTPLAGFAYVVVSFAAGIVLSIAVALFARRRQQATGEQWPVGWVSAALVLGLPLIVYVALGRPLDWSVPVLKGFNFQGGLRLTPEFVALTFALVLYTASFIAEIVRSGILAVSHGQTEAARALGLASGPTRRLVIMPQAMRVITPPLTNQYLNVTKNSSLAVFIGYPDLVQIFAGTVLNQTGAAVQVISITMAVYLLISLVTSVGMNFYNSRMMLRER